MKFTLIRNGDDKTLMAGTKKVATWDKHDSYDSCVALAEARMSPDDELVEKQGKDTPKEEKPVQADSGASEEL